MSSRVPSRPTITSTRNELSAGFIAQYFGLEQCGPYANLEESSTGKRIASRTYSNPLTNPLHLAVGREFEQDQLLALGSTAERVFGPSDEAGIPSDGPNPSGEWDDYPDATVEFCELVQQVARDPPSACPTVAWQTKLLGQIGDWPVKGKADLIALTPGGPHDAYDVHIRILEAKSSITRRTAHRVQATVYALLIEQAMDGLAIDVKIEGGIINPENSLAATPLADIETFEFDTMASTLEAALAADGHLTAAIEDNYDDMPRRLAPRCAGCPHEQVCLTEELQTGGLGLGLLQLDEGLQETLHDIGITSLSKLAELVDLSSVDRYGEVDNWEDIPFEAGAGPIVDEIRERTNISNLRQLSVGAARYVDEVEPGNHDYWPAAIQGSGYGLPADDPSRVGDVQYPPDSLIKVFIIVVPDPVRDCVLALAAYVTSRNGEDTVIAYPQRLPRDSPHRENRERSLIFRFFKQLGKIIDRLSPDIRTQTDDDGDYYTNQDGNRYASTDGFPHLYFFDERQREVLMDAVRRHDSLRSANAVRSLLGLRSAIAGHSTTDIPDQSMVSVLARELRQRFAMRFIGLGLIQTVAQFHDGNDWFGWDQPPYGRHGPKPSLTEIFAADLFEMEVGYTVSSGSVDVNHTGSPGVLSGDAQAQFGSSYPMANRHATTLPAAYIWAERDKLTPKWAANDKEKAAIHRYQYRTDSQTDRITEEDIKALLGRMAASLAHIEQGLEVPANRYWSDDAGKDSKVAKSPLDVSQLVNLNLGNGSLASTVQEYGLLEHGSGVDGAIYRFRKPLDERVESGRSLVLDATDAWEDDSGRYTNYFLEGNIVDPTTIGVGGASHRTIPRSIQEGDWKVITEIDPTCTPPRIRDIGDRARIVRSTVVIIDSLDDAAGTIRLKCMDTGRWLRTNTPCVTSHRTPVVLSGSASGPNPTPASNYITTYLQEGRSYVLDGFTDSIDKMRAFTALSAATNRPTGASGNSLYDHINDLYTR